MEYFKISTDYERFTLYEPSFKYKTNNNKFVCKDCFDKCKPGVPANPCQQECAAKLNKWSEEKRKSYWILIN